MARARGRRRLAVVAGSSAQRGRARRASGWSRPRDRDRLSPAGAWVLIGVLFALVAITLPELGSDPWHFRPGTVDPHGPARAAGAGGGRGVGPRHPARVLLPRRPAVRRGRDAADRAPARLVEAGSRSALVLAVALLLTAPATLLQLGLRDSTAPWFFTNDSTYQIEQGGDLLLHLDNPYGHDYRESGLERFYTRDGTVSERVREKRGGAPALRLLPRHGLRRGGLAAAARSRSTTTGC